MDDLTSYYAPPIHHPYYQPAPPPPAQPTILPPPVVVAPPPIHAEPQYLAYSPYPQSPHDEVRTLFVAGLPEDVKPREIYNLFREFPGYVTSHLRPPTANGQPFAFATFTDQQAAIMALHSLNGMVFDLEKNSTLHVDLAKSNSRSKRPRGDDERQSSEKRQKGPDAFLRRHEPGVGSVHMPGMANSTYSMNGYPSTQSYANNRDGQVKEGATKSNNTPCPTLFVANLGPTCTEQELMQVFSRCRGFIKLKMQTTYGPPVAFVDFQDTSSSTEALSHLQGTRLYSSTAGEGMRLEFAKSRMGMRSKKSR